MPEKEKSIKRDALGILPKTDGFHCPQAEHDVLYDQKLKFDPETGSTTVDESETIDLVALIQSYKDQCGMEMVQKLIRIGQASPHQFADDGQHGGDATMPVDINDAFRQTLAGAGDLYNVAKTLGMKITEDTTPEEIQARIQQIRDAMNPQPKESEVKE